MYIDIIFFENAYMDCILLLATSIVLNKKVKFFKLIVSGIIGSLAYLIYILSKNSEFLQSIIWNTKCEILYIYINKVIIALIMLQILFGKNSMRNKIRELAVFFMVSFIFSGCAISMIDMINKKDKFLTKILILSTIPSIFIIRQGIHIIRRNIKLQRKDMIVNLTIENSKKTKIKAFIDTGNFLRDQNKNKPIIIVEKEKMKEILEETDFKEISELAIKGKKQINNPRIGTIPYQSIGNPNATIVTYEVDKVVIDYLGKNHAIKNVLIGLCNETLNKKGKYSALIGLEILERSQIENEYNTIF